MQENPTTFNAAFAVRLHHKTIILLASVVYGWYPFQLISLYTTQARSMTFKYLSILDLPKIFNLGKSRTFGLHNWCALNKALNIIFFQCQVIIIFF